MVERSGLTGSKPSQTALRVALRRAAHQVVDGDPLVLRDPFARRILGPEANAELQRTPSATRKPFSAALRAWIVVRVRYAEDVLATAVRTQAITQYLLLGAGLDTFALRNPHPGLRVFEVDHPATQALKRERLANADLPLPASTHFVPVDFDAEALLPKLAQAGFVLTQPVVVAWLGVIPYLSEQAFHMTIQALGSLAPGSTVVFDYAQPREALPPVEQLMRDSLAARVAQTGEPFQLFFTPDQLREALARSGLQVVDDLGTTELNQRFLSNRSDGLALRGQGMRLCRATVG